MKSNKGITLVSLITSLILLIILSAITISTSMNSYNQMKFEGAKTELEEVQNLVEEIASDYQTYLKEYDTSRTYVNYFEDRYGATGANSFSNKLLSANTSNISALTTAKSSEINTSSPTAFYWTEDDLVKFFDLKGIEPVVVDFSTRKAYSVNGIKDKNDNDRLYWTPSDWQAKTTIVKNETEVNLLSNNIEVEYIQSSGSQYIMTDIVPNNTMGAYMKLSTQDRSNNLIYFGSKNNAANSGNNRFFVANQSNKVYFGFNTNDVASSDVELDTIFSIEFNYQNSRKKIYNNSLVANINTTFDTSNTYPISIFGLNQGSVNFRSKIKFYELKISEGDKVTHDFIPVKNKILNKYGLYDKIGKKFYGNSNSSGSDFTGGAETGYEILEYLQSSGNEYIDTGVKPNQDISIEVDGFTMDNVSIYGTVAKINCTGSSTNGGIMFFDYGGNQRDY